MSAILWSLAHSSPPVPEWKEKYLEGHVGGIDHSEYCYAKVGKDAGGEKEHSGYEERDEDVGGPEVESLCETVDWCEWGECLVDVIEGGIGEGFDAVEHDVNTGY